MCRVFFPSVSFNHLPFLSLCTYLHFFPSCWPPVELSHGQIYGRFSLLSLFMLGLFQDFQDDFNKELTPGTFHQLSYNNPELLPCSSTSTSEMVIILMKRKKKYCLINTSPDVKTSWAHVLCKNKCPRKLQEQVEVSLMTGDNQVECKRKVLLGDVFNKWGANALIRGFMSSRGEMWKHGCDGLCDRFQTSCIRNDCVLASTSQ